MIKRQALSILTYVGLALQGMTIAPEDGNVSDTSYSSQIISSLLDLSTAKNTKPLVDDIAKAARVAIEHALRAMSARDFVQSVLVVLQSGTLVSSLMVFQMIA